VRRSAEPGTAIVADAEVNGPPGCVQYQSSMFVTYVSVYTALRKLNPGPVQRHKRRSQSYDLRGKFGSGSGIWYFRLVKEGQPLEL
jgi:hypothetical protein